MSISTRLLAVMTIGGLAMGCSEEAPPPAPPAPTADSAPKPASPAVPKYNPTYTLAVDGNTVTWTAEVNTGGWTMKTDRVLVEDSMGKTVARVYVILEQPGADEMTTQAMETLEGKHEADKKLDAAELSVKRVVRGQDTTFPALYAVVKRTGK